MDKYYFSDLLNDHRKELILKSIDILKGLNAPITDECFFDVIHRDRVGGAYGYCGKHASHKYRISIFDGIEKDADYINVAIHELLHTIPNEGATSHKGEWLKWAKIVSDNTPYKISTTSKLKTHFVNVTKEGKKPKTILKIICPKCKRESKGYYTKGNIPKDNHSGYVCPKCSKPMFLSSLEHPLTTLQGEQLRQKEKEYELKSLTLDELSEVLPFTSFELTKRLIIKFIKENEFNSQIHEAVLCYVATDKRMKKALSEAYCLGLMDDSFKSINSVYEFESMFALTDLWMDNREHGKALIKKLENQQSF